KYEHVITGTYIDCDFSRANLHRSRASTPLRFDRCNFTGTNFSGSQWDLTQFQDCQFMDTNIKRAEWTLLKFTRCNFSNIQVKDAHVAGCSFIEPRQNMKWYDEDKNAAFTHVVRDDAAWVDWDGANISDVRIK